jgi:hypothetical protein
MQFSIVKHNGFKLLNGSETEFEGTSLRRFLEIITEEPDVIIAYRNQQINIDDDSLSIKESDLIIAAMDSALADEIFSDVELGDEY